MRLLLCAARFSRYTTLERYRLVGETLADLALFAARIKTTVEFTPRGSPYLLVRTQQVDEWLASYDLRQEPWDFDLSINHASIGFWLAALKNFHKPDHTEGPRYATYGTEDEDQEQ